MKITINKTQFVSYLLSDEYAKWTIEAAETLFDYYTELEEGSGEEIEFDRVAIRCDWAEMTAHSVIENYSDQFGKKLTEDDKLSGEDLGEFVWEFLLNETQVYKLSNGNFLFIQF